MNEKQFSQSNRFRLVVLNIAGYDPGTGRHSDCAEKRRYRMLNPTRMTRFLQRCWIAACYMYRLNYSCRLAWAKAAR